MSNDNEVWSWDEEDDKHQILKSEQAVDLSFKLDCKSIKVDHTRPLHDAITGTFPWVTEQPLAGLHLIHVAGSQNGWMRPEEPDEVLHLSRRTRLVLRIPLSHLQEALELTGQSFDVDGHEMAIGEAIQKPLLASNILYARHVISGNDQDENQFLHQVADELRQLKIQFKKLLPGKQLNLRGPQGLIKTRSLMIADISDADSITLQERGLGEGRDFGCGLFIHHKGIKTARPDD